MEKKVDKKFTWVIKNFSSLGSEAIYSDKFDVRGCKWCLSAYPIGNKVDNHLSLYLTAVDYRSLPSGWRRHTRYLLTVVNQCSEKLSRQKDELKHWFDEKSFGFGYPSMVSLNELNAKDSGFLVNDELKIVVELELLEIVGKVEVNGFQLLPSQVENVSRMFEKHPNIASEVCPKNPNVRAGCMSMLLSLIDTLCQSPHQLQDDHLDEAYAALKYLTKAGFKLDWLEMKLDQVPEKRKKVKVGETQMQKTEKQLKNSKQKCSDLEVKLEKEKEKVSAAKARLSFDDII